MRQFGDICKVEFFKKLSIRKKEGNMFEKLSIQKKMNYLVGMVSLFVFLAAISIFFAMRHIESKYEHLYHSSMKESLITLKMEKNLNNTSRLTRDIMLGGDY